MNKKTLHLNILTYCDDKKNSKRFSILKKCILSLRDLKNKNVFISLWDNGSSSKVIEYLLELDFIDYFYFSQQNYFDVAPIRALAAASDVLGNEYICHMEDDLEVIEPNCINEILNFLEDNNDTAGIRLTKFDIHKPHLYDKAKQNPDTDTSNMMSLFNAVDGSSLLWEGPYKYKKYDFFKCNWHWYNFPIIAKSRYYKKIIPLGNVEPLQHQEIVMREKFHQLNKKLGILNGGVVNHLGTFDKEGSMRLFVRDNLNENVDGTKVSGQFPAIDNVDINKEVSRYITGLKKCLNQN